MKNFVKFLGIFTLAVVIGFSATACDIGIDEDAVSGMETLELSGQVYLENWNGNDSISYQDYTGNLTVSGNYGGSGAITNGKLKYSIGTPGNLKTLNFKDFLDDFGSITSTPASVKGVVLEVLDISGSGDYYGVGKGNTAISAVTNGFLYTFEDVMYVYVEKDLTVSGRGSTDGPRTETVGDTQFTHTVITKDFSLALKTGWNAVYLKDENLETSTGTVTNPPKKVVSTDTYTVSLGNPDLKWVLNKKSDRSLMPQIHIPLTNGQWIDGRFTPGMSFLRRYLRHSVHY
jgi:hypothetical protein